MSVHTQNRYNAMRSSETFPCASLKLASLNTARANGAAAGEVSDATLFPCKVSVHQQLISLCRKKAYQFP